VKTKWPQYIYSVRRLNLSLIADVKDLRDAIAKPPHCCQLNPYLSQHLDQKRGHSRLSKDYERLADNSEAVMYVAMIDWIFRRLCTT